MNPRFQRVLDIATIDIENRMNKLLEKWSQNGSQTNENGSRGQLGSNSQESGSDSSAITIPEQGSGDGIEGTGN
jgi:hypothetical protein